ncbi:radical SAM protein, partial [candidate division KSB1 bacterium]|nr:radical SAM protein [candidate division KSB1 bacterium]
MFEVPELLMAGMSLNRTLLPRADELISLPQGSCLFTLPGRAAVGFDPNKNRFVVLKKYLGQPVQAVAAFMAPAYSQIYLAAYHKKENAPDLPLF